MLLTMAEPEERREESSMEAKEHPPEQGLAGDCTTSVQSLRHGHSTLPVAIPDNSGLFRSLPNRSSRILFLVSAIVIGIVVTLTIMLVVFVATEESPSGSLPTSPSQSPMTLMPTQCSAEEPCASLANSSSETGPPTIPNVTSESPSMPPRVEPNQSPSASPILDTQPPTSAPTLISSSTTSVPPSNSPSASHSTLPTAPLAMPSDMLSEPPSVSPTTPPFSVSTLSSTSMLPTYGSSSAMPSEFPSQDPSQDPSLDPSMDPSQEPTLGPSPPLVPVTYFPGHLTQEENGLILSAGLTARVLATSGEPVVYASGALSQEVFHALPDFGATFERPDGGWVYVSNSEVREPADGGGVGALTFDAAGNLVDYHMLLQGTRSNCGGGRTPWETWISCEEYARGQCWQVDPTEQHVPLPITLGSDGGFFESFAFDGRNSHFFITEDHEFGPLRRFTPDTLDWSDPWTILHGSGTTEYLMLFPNDDSDNSTGSFTWMTSQEIARINANMYYPNAEGVDVVDHELYFISKELKSMFILDLDSGNYTRSSTRHGLFNAQPDQIQRVLGGRDDDLLYFTEDGGPRAGIHCRNAQGQYFTILESEVYEDETTGLAFSPDGRHMYIAYQVNGLLFDVTRTDGYPFDAVALNVKYHNDATGIQ